MVYVRSINDHSPPCAEVTMSDDELRAIKAQWPDGIPTDMCAPDVCMLVVALADEALARGATVARLQEAVRQCPLHDELRERVAQLERELAHFKAPDALPDQTWQEVLDRALERVAQLETALRNIAEGQCDVPMSVLQEGKAAFHSWFMPWAQAAAKAALAAGKP